MNALDCLVHSQVGTEAFPGVVLEAYACGRPVIASALDGIPEAFAVADFGQLVKPESVPELAEAMRAWAVRPTLPPAGAPHCTRRSPRTSRCRPSPGACRRYYQWLMQR